MPKPVRISVRMNASCLKALQEYLSSQVKDFLVNSVFSLQML